MLHYTTQDYIRMLRDLEDGLYQDPSVSYHTIKRDEHKNLNIYVRLKELPSHLDKLMEKAKLVGALAVHVQKFAAAKISFCDEVDKPILKQIIVV